MLVGALSRLGARQNPLIPIYRGREVGFITTQSDASLLIVPTVYRGFDFEAMAREVAAARPGLQVLVVDRQLPDGDPAGLPPVASAPQPGRPRPPSGGSSIPRAPPLTPRAPSTPTSR